MCKTAYQLTVSKTVWVEIPEKDLPLSIDKNVLYFLDPNLVPIGFILYLR